MHKEKFLKLVSAILGSRTNAFTDFLTIAATSIANGNKSDETTWQERESLFKETLQKYDAKTQLIFRDMFTELALALEDRIAKRLVHDESLNLNYNFTPINKPHYHDVLGEIFSELNQNDQKDGQVFTPQHMGTLMGELAMTEDFVRSEISRHGFITITEPCCGSGAITLGALNTLLGFGISPNHQCLVLASDMDMRCVLMTYIQLSLYCIPAIVVQKDALTGKEWSARWLTPMLTAKKCPIRAQEKHNILTLKAKLVNGGGFN